MKNINLLLEKSYNQLKMIFFKQSHIINIKKAVHLPDKLVSSYSKFCQEFKGGNHLVKTLGLKSGSHFKIRPHIFFVALYFYSRALFFSPALLFYFHSSIFFFNSTHIFSVELNLFLILLLCSTLFFLS